jgi:hypothetical protein
MCVFGERQVLAAAQNRDVALDAWRDALEVAEDAGLSVRDVKRTNGREEFWIGNARYKVVSSTRRGGRGLSADLVILDEVREYRDWDAWAALEKTRRARKSSQVWAVSNEGDDGSVVLAALSSEGRAVASSGEVSDLAWFEWSAPDGLARDDPLGWRWANPALGSLIDPQTVYSESRHDAPEVFETEVLCRRVVSLRPWIPLEVWGLSADAGVSVPDGSEVVFGLDAGPELRHATIAVGWRRPDGRVHVEAVAGFTSGDGPVLVRAGVRLAELVERWSPNGVVVVARSASDAAAFRILEGLDVPLVRVTGGDLAAAVSGFYESVLGRRLVHPPDPMTDSHVGAVTTDGLLARRSTFSDIDGAVALVLAHHGALHVPTRSQPQDWVAY